MQPVDIGREELEYPRTVKTLRPGRQGEGVVTVDGPYIESKEFLGGFIVIEVADWDEALQIAWEWPSLVSQRNAHVSVQRVFESVSLTTGGQIGSALGQALQW
jgi:hypothetical protein